MEPTIRIEMQDFREVLPFADAHINEHWVRGYDWMVHVSKVLAIPDTHYQWLEDEPVQRVLDKVTELFITVRLTTGIVYVPDRVQPHIRHKLALFHGDGVDKYVRDRYVDTFRLKELRGNNNGLLWTPDEMFFTGEVKQDE